MSYFSQQMRMRTTTPPPQTTRQATRKIRKTRSAERAGSATARTSHRKVNNKVVTAAALVTAGLEDLDLTTTVCLDLLPWAP